MEEIAQVYARALFEVAKEQGKLDLVREQLGQFADALNENGDLRVFFFSPYFSTEEKKDGLHSALVGRRPGDRELPRDRCSSVTACRSIFRIRDEYERLWDEENKLLPVEVTSAVDLDDATVKSIGERIGEQTGQRVELTSRVDPSILGGHRPARRQLDPRRLDQAPPRPTSQARRAGLAAALPRSH